ncbi:stage V sporulation protein D (sporulation-specific penicillin-binding protein) [Lachnospiraceae bacterium XBB1006]|nr:stage V sporulation protein D (sporulation-specific penicillin-binding protein) [Lachnospiraceae bacterium XBB1006]
MARRRRLKNTRLTRPMRKKIIVVLGIVFSALFFLVGRMIYIQLVDGDRYERKVLDQQEYSSQVLPYKRGDIVDRKNTILATSKDVFNVVLDCRVLNAKKTCIDSTVQALVTCFSMKGDEVRQQLKDTPRSQYCILKKKVSYEKTKKFRELQAEKDSHIAGVWFEKEYEREYPYKTLASSVIGFVTKGNEGINGLERSYNSILNGEDGREYGYLSSDNDYEKTVVKAKDGKTIVSTIDMTIQSMVEKKVTQFNKEHDGYKGRKQGSAHTAVLVMNPNSGEVLAMAQYPFYDLSNPRDLSHVYKKSVIAKMSAKKKLAVLNDLWNNFCVTATYEPGSTAKPFTVAMGLDSGKLHGNETFVCNGSEKVGDHLIHCANRNGHGKETIEKAINNSCNDALMQIGRKIGVSTFTKYQSIFGFGRKTGIDLPGEARTDSLIYTKETMNPTALATNSFGQNFNATMIQLGSGFCSLINGGNYYQPHMVKEIRNADGSLYEEVKPTLLKQTISAETSRYLRRYLYTTVKKGTAHSAQVEGYTMGGKTGTAEKLPRGNKKYLVSFIGFAPAKNPQVMIYVIIDEPHLKDQAQSSLATNLAKEILTQVLPYMNIYPDANKKGAVPQIKAPEENYEQGIFE